MREHDRVNYQLSETNDKLKLTKGTNIKDVRKEFQDVMSQLNTFLDKDAKL